MRTNGKTPVVIFSVSSAAVLDAIRATNPLLVVQEGKGCYKGQEEDAYCINLSNFTDQVRAILHGDEQESVLILDNQYNAWLSFKRDGYPTYADGKCAYLGEFREVTSGHAKKCDGWSQFGDKFYVAG